MLETRTYVDCLVKIHILLTEKIVKFPIKAAMENIVIDDSFLTKFLGEIVCRLLSEETVFTNL